MILGGKIVAEDKNNSEEKVKNLIGERRRHRVVHEDDLEWQRIRWPGEWGKVAFHPREDDPTEPIFGITRFDPGGHFPDHAHDFAQVWYILKGSCTVAGETIATGSFIYHPDPHVERELYTEDGVTILFCQHPGANTGGRPIYDKRFDINQRQNKLKEPITF